MKELECIDGAYLIAEDGLIADYGHAEDMPVGDLPEYRTISSFREGLCWI